jgi:Luciferase-like monooxygenase
VSSPARSCNKSPPPVPKGGKRSCHDNSATCCRPAKRSWRGRPETAPLLKLAEQAASLGFVSLWVGDSVTARPRHEPLTLLAAVSGRTPALTIGTATRRRPRPFAGGEAKAGLHRSIGAARKLEVPRALVQRPLRGSHRQPASVKAAEAVMPCAAAHRCSSSRNAIAPMPMCGFGRGVLGLNARSFRTGARACRGPCCPALRRHPSRHRSLADVPRRTLPRGRVWRRRPRGVWRHEAAAALPELGSGHLRGVGPAPPNRADPTRIAALFRNAFFGVVTGSRTGARDADDGTIAGLGRRCRRRHDGCPFGCAGLSPMIDGLLSASALIRGNCPNVG